MKKLDGKAVLYRGNKLLLVLSIVSGLLESGCRLSIAWILQNVIDFIAKRNGYSLKGLLIISVITFALLAISILLDYFVSPRFSNKAIKQYRDYIFNRTLTKSPDSFYNEDFSSYISFLTNDIVKIQDNYLDQIREFVEQIVVFLGAVVMMISCEPVLSLLSLGISAIPMAFSILAGKRIPAKERSLSERNAKYVSFIRDVFAGFSVIKCFKAENNVVKNHSNTSSELTSSLVDRDRSYIVVSSTSHFLGNLSQIAVFLLCAYYTSISDRVTAGTVVLFIQLMNYIIRPIETIPKMWAGRKAALELIKMHDENLAQNHEDKKVIRLSQDQTDIELRNLSYEYSDGKKALDNLDIVFNTGKCYLVIGESGSGKTTLLNVLSGIKRDYRGSVLVGDVELKDISQESLFDICSFMQQSVYIFNDTIENNITMYSVFADKEVENAIRMAGLENVIREKGLRYQCGDGGNQLSGGEKQRIAIARSILRKQRIIFMDEATSALDNENVRKINDTLLSLTGTTRIIVAHSFDQELAQKCDGILALKEGRIVEFGTFNELIKQNGYFYSMYTLLS